jgi:hypothetical protein
MLFEGTLYPKEGTKRNEIHTTVCIFYGGREGETYCDVEYKLEDITLPNGIHINDASNYDAALATLNGQREFEASAVDIGNGKFRLSQIKMGALSEDPIEIDSDVECSGL